MKDERNILTRESITGKLIYEAKRSIVGCAMIFVLGVVVFGMMYLALSMALPTGSKAPLITVAFFFVGLMLVCAFLVIRALLHMGKAKRGEFSVALDVLEDVKDNKLNVWRMLRSRSFFDRSNYEHIFVFKSGKRFVANSAEYRNTSIDATAQFSMSGDTFILVSYNDAPEKILLLYSEKLYSYKQ